MENDKFNDNKTAFANLIETINSNKQFSRLILYSLNTLKSHLVVINTNLAYENSVKILQNNFMSCMENLYETHLHNEELITVIYKFII
jgi:hypothetical protein